MSGLVPHTAMLLAAGLGSRMRPVTETRPKALVEVNGKALIDHALDRLAEAGVARAVVNVHHFADRIQAHLAARTGGPEIVVSDEREALLETGGALVKARPLFGEDPIFVFNIDAVWLEYGPPALARLAAGYDAQRMDERLLLAPTVASLGLSDHGDFDMDVWGQVSWRAAGELAPFNYAGVRILHPRVLNGAACAPFSASRFWRKSAREGRLFGQRLDGFWMHVGDPDALKYAERIFALGLRP